MSSPYGTPDRPFGTPAPQGRRGRPLRTGILSGLVSLPATIIFFPIGLVLGVLAIVTAVRALRRGGGQVVTRAVVAIIAGAVSTLIAVLCIVLIALVWPQYKSFSTCQRNAVTIADKSQCQNTFRGDIERRFGIPAGTIPRVP